MIKLLIVDDELLEREGLACIIQTLMPNRIEIFMAENGRKAIELAEEVRPDIVFMDIKMPGISGIDAAHSIQEIIPNCKLVIVSAYDEFDFAREALQLGVKDYLLKPVKNETIMELLDKLMNDITQDRKKRYIELEMKEKLGRLHELAESDCILHVMHGFHPSDEHLDLLGIDDLEHTHAYCLVAHFDNLPEKANRIRTKLHEELKIGPILVSPMIGSNVCIFCLEKENASKIGTFRAMALQTAKLVSQILESFTQTPIVIGIGGNYIGPEGWSKSYQEANYAVRKELPIKWRFYHDIQTTHENTPLIELEKQFVSLVMEGSTKAEDYARDYCKYLMQMETDDSFNLGHFLSSFCAILIWEASYMGISTPEPVILRQLDDNDALIEHFLAFINRMVGQFQEFHGDKRSSLYRVKEYIEEHFTEELTLEMMAEKAQLSPFYFSKQFKALFGESFVEYLKHLRMKAAVQLIKEGKHNLKEICYAVGYNNPPYFSRVFKKYYGVAPSEWKDS